MHAEPREERFWSALARWQSTMLCDRCNADNMKAVLVELPPSADVTTTADSVREHAVTDRDDVNSSRRLGRLGNSISRVTARFSQQRQQQQPAEQQQPQPQQQQQQQQQSRKQDSETSAL